MKHFTSRNITISPKPKNHPVNYIAWKSNISTVGEQLQAATFQFYSTFKATQSTATTSSTKVNNRVCKPCVSSVSKVLRSIKLEDYPVSAFSVVDQCLPNDKTYSELSNCLAAYTLGKRKRDN